MKKGFLITIILCFIVGGAFAAQYTFHKDSVSLLARKVANRQISDFTYSETKNLHDFGIDSWTNSTFFIGLFEWAKADNNNPVYLRWLDNIGRKTSWTLPKNFINHPAYQLYHADEFCIGQFYVGMYHIYKDSAMLQSAQKRADWVMDNPPNPNMSAKNKQSWTWCDALFMAPPLYALLAEASNDVSYLEFMDAEFKKTYNHLYDKKHKLLYRDDSFFEKREQNGEKIFWGRGNGWVAAGMANLLKVLPENSSYRPYYEKNFRKLMKRLVALQNSSGFWHASLLDPVSYPAPETSATALITYSLAYGLNSGLLKGKRYETSLEKGWTALNSIVDSDGKLGWVQPIGADPKKVTQDMTAPYGVGAFLLAASEIYRGK